MADNIIKRDGNLVEVDFRKKGNPGRKAAGAAMSGAAIGAIIPVLAIGGATPFLNPDNNGKPESDKPLESRLHENPGHFSKSASELINEREKKKPWDGSYVGHISGAGEAPGKSR